MQARDKAKEATCAGWLSGVIALSIRTVGCGGSRVGQATEGSAALRPEPGLSLFVLAAAATVLSPIAIWAGWSKRHWFCEGQRFALAWGTLVPDSCVRADGDVHGGNGRNRWGELYSVGDWPWG
jgi:hypothetical protein